MLLAILKYMDQELGPCQYDLVSVYPTEDSEQNTRENLNVVSGKPAHVLGAFILSALLGWLSFLPFIKSLLSINPLLKSILESDLILDSSGVAFIDGRGLAILGYNCCLCTPPLFVGTPIVKLSQALGPFKTEPNRTLAKLILSRIPGVIARGEITASHLEDLKLKNTELCADSAFSMPLENSDMTAAKELLVSLLQNTGYTSGKQLLGISPSTVVDTYAAKEGKNYKVIMAEFIREAASRNLHIVLIPHSVRPGSEKRMNNDLIVCREIAEELNNPGYLSVVDRELSAPVLRALIGEMNLYIASRFHSMVSSLAMKNPTILIGWSHKYREVMRMFDLEDYALSYSDLSKERLIEELDRLITEEESVNERLNSHLPEVQKSSRRNFSIAADLLKGSPIEN
jgi:polysaccharide pyruvyl transferase WcaK-like protein